MDPLTQGVVGATLAQSTKKTAERKKQMLIAGLFGLVGGLAPDLDVLIKSETDPLIYLEYHRQFTHSLIFIPIGGLICAGLLHLIIGRFISLSFKQTFLFACIGYATHGFIDAATSYGTMLFWPFSDYRVAWNIISIIDPIFTLPILVLVISSMILNKPKLGRIALCWGLLYMGFGLYQNQRAIHIGEELAAKRGHIAEDLSAKPSFGNNLVYKIIYEYEDIYYVDAVHLGWEEKLYPGASIAALDIDRDLPWLDKNSQQAQDIERFRWFSKGYIALDPTNTRRIIDLRYSLLPNEVTGLWSIELSPTATADSHVKYQEHRDPTPARRATLWAMIKGEDIEVKLSQKDQLATYNSEESN